MRIQITLNADGVVFAQAIHRAARTRNYGAKADEHRYERRKMREYLRHPDAATQDIAS